MRLNENRWRRLAEVAWVFGRLGCVAFGGPAAHVALQEEECVRRRRWLDRATFLDLLAATNLIPGPNSTEMAMHLGRLRAGLPGLVVGGVAFILPSALLVGALAAAYVRHGTTPAATGLLDGIRPAILVIIADALARFGRQAVRGAGTAMVTLAAAALALGGASEVLLVFAAAALGAVLFAPGRLHAVPVLELAWVFTKIGATLFGSGYVLVAYLRAELGARGWLDDAVLLDAVAVGQVTPGPVSTTATFVGYLLAGPPGAALATVALFLPGFVLVATTGPLLERLRDVPVVRAALDGVNAAVTGLIAAVVVGLAPAALGSPFGVAVAGLAAVAVWGLRASGTAVAAAAAVLGLAHMLVAG
jgi:chromate transporter